MEVSYAKFKKEIYRELARTSDLSKKEEESSLEKKDFLLNGLSSGQKFLDIGCGTGKLLLEASLRVREKGGCWGVDISWEMLAIARERTHNQHNIQFYQDDVTLGLSFADNSFDLVVAANLLQEIPSVSFALGEISRVTKPDGCFRLLIPCLAEDNQINKAFAFMGRKYYWYFHTEKELRQILADNSLLGEYLTIEFQANEFKGLTREQTAFKGFELFLADFQNLGYNPTELTQGTLLVEGKKNFG